MPYRQYFSHVTAGFLSKVWSVASHASRTPTSRSCVARDLSFVAHSRAFRRTDPWVTMLPCVLKCVNQLMSSLSMASTCELFCRVGIFFTGLYKVSGCVLFYLQFLISFSLILNSLYTATFVWCSAKLITRSLELVLRCFFVLCTVKAMIFCRIFANI